MQEMTIEEYGRVIKESTYNPRTFTQRVIDRMFPHPLKPYGSAVWVVGRNLKMRQDGVLK